MLARFVVAICILLFAGSALAQKRVALLIGNQDYKRGVGKLVNPFNDIRIVGNALGKVGFDVLEPVKNGTRIDILDALQRYTDKLKDAGPDAIGFVYYSGHGIASKGANYLIPVEVERPSSRQLRAYGLKQSEVLAILRKDASNAAHYVVIDACRNELKGARGSKGFLPVNQQSGTLIAFATAPGQTASDIGSQSGPYAKALAAEIVKPGVNDLNMFHSVRVAVSKATDGDQVPWTLDGIQREERPFFAGKPQQQGPFSDALATRFKRMQEAAPEWKKLANTTGRKKLHDFAKRYAGTGYDSLALAKLAAMDRKIIDQVSKDWLKRKNTKPSQTARACNGVKVKLAGGRTQCIRPGSGQSFKDCDYCPEMVVVPAGSFMMGSPTGEVGRPRGTGEWPENDSGSEEQVQVTISHPFAIGKYEISFEKWKKCVSDGGCKYVPKGYSDLPASSLSWRHINEQYLPWLSRKTGKIYRLPSEAEWEYAARAGTTSAFWWGGTISPDQANYNGSVLYLPPSAEDRAKEFNRLSQLRASEAIAEMRKSRRKGLNRKAPLPVTSFRPNPWGLYNVHGNVSEWTNDCWNLRNEDNPGDGSARATGDCSRRVIRGGSWHLVPQYVRAARRERSFGLRWSSGNGFRVVRVLRP